MRKDFGAKTWMYPLPVLIIGTYDEEGNADAMNAAWGGIYDSNQVVLCRVQTIKPRRTLRQRGRLLSALLMRSMLPPVIMSALFQGTRNLIR